MSESTYENETQLPGFGSDVHAGEGCWEDDRVVDQALLVVAEQYRALGMMLGHATAAPTPAALRHSPLGRDLRLLASADRRTTPPQETLEAVRRVRELLLRPLAADDYAIPAWFTGSALGRLIAQAERVAAGPDGLLTPAAAARQLGIDEARLNAWLADGSLPSVPDDSGRPLVSREVIARRRLVALPLREPASSTVGHDDAPRQDVIVRERRLAS